MVRRHIYLLRNEKYSTYFYYIRVFEVGGGLKFGGFSGKI